MQDFTESQLVELIEAAKEAAVHRINSDTCGVCGLHFHECEEDVCSDDFPITPETKVYFSCAGARLRKVFVESKKLLVKDLGWWL
jgi:hypothetical protein